MRLLSLWWKRTTRLLALVTKVEEAVLKKTYVVNSPACCNCMVHTLVVWKGKIQSITLRSTTAIFWTLVGPASPAVHPPSATSLRMSLLKTLILFPSWIYNFNRVSTSARRATQTNLKSQYSTHPHTKLAMDSSWHPANTVMPVGIRFLIFTSSVPSAPPSTAMHVFFVDIFWANYLGCEW